MGETQKQLNERFLAYQEKMKVQAAFQNWMIWQDAVIGILSTAQALYNMNCKSAADDETMELAKNDLRQAIADFLEVDRDGGSEAQGGQPGSARQRCDLARASVRI